MSSLLIILCEALFIARMRFVATVVRGSLALERRRIHQDTPPSYASHAHAVQARRTPV